MRLKIIFSIVILTCIEGSADMDAQVLRDSAAFRIIKECVDDIYNLDLRSARNLCERINRKYPGHPGVYLLDGLIRYWENYPLLPGTEPASLFEKDLRKSIQLGELKHNPEDAAEYLLIDLCARGLLLLFFSDNNVTSEVYPLAMSTYPYLRRAFASTKEYYDFYFFTGLYNYYREAYPEAHPVYKALAFLFPKGNKEEGLRELQMAGDKSLVLNAESYSFLTWIYNNFEHNYLLATYTSRKLSALYPDNVYFLATYIRNLLLSKNYDEAEKLIHDEGEKHRYSFFKAETEVFRGIIQEKKFHNSDEAKRHYEKGIMDLTPFCSYGNECTAYAYFGLSRISESKGDYALKKSYHKQAAGLTASGEDDFSK